MTRPKYYPRRKALISVRLGQATYHLGVMPLWWVWGYHSTAFTAWWGVGPFVLRERTV